VWGEGMKQIPLSPYQEILNSVEKILIVKDMFRNEPDIWCFHIKGKILRIGTRDLENSKKFREVYLKAFNILLPLITKQKWCALLTELSKDTNRIYERIEGSETPQCRSQGNL
jgi:hypothetical protein